jgi:hypothetical protein
LKQPEAKVPEGATWEEYNGMHRLFGPNGESISLGATKDEAIKLINREEREKMLADALKNEGEMMGHCVGGYCPDVLEGRSRIYTLRGSKGEPHVTIETEPPQQLYPVSGEAFAMLPQATKAQYGQYVREWRQRNPHIEELTDEHTAQALKEAGVAPMPERIVQIKGKQNAAPVDKYLPYVQDFVKSGNWSDVGDLGNTGLYKADPQELGMFIPQDPRLRNLPGRRTEDFQRAKDAGLFGDKKYFTRDEWEDILRKQIESESGPLPPLKPEGMARGGKVHMVKGNDQSDMDAMRLSLNQHGMYSPLEKAAMAVPRQKGTHAEFMAEVSKQPGFRAEEVADRRISAREGKMTKAEFLEHIQKNHPAPLIEEKVHKEVPFDEYQRLTDEFSQEMFGDDYHMLSSNEQKKIRDRLDSMPQADHEQWTLPGGENYREVLLKKPGFTGQKAIMEIEANLRRTDDPATQIALMKRLTELKQKQAEHGDIFPGNQSHFGGEPGIIASLRLKDRAGPNGEKILHVEEVQSDWHQEGRKSGYKNPTEKKLTGTVVNNSSQFGSSPDYMVQWSDGTFSGGYGSHEEAQKRLEEGKTDQKKFGVPDAPFKKNWHELALKHALGHAANNGYDGIVITPGQAQADRYDLSKQVKNIYHSQNEDGTFHASVLAPNGQVLWEDFRAPPEKIEQYLGKDITSKIVGGVGDEEGGMRRLDPKDMKMGGEGMKGFYDKIVPDFLNKFGKKYGAKVQMNDHRIKGSPEDYAKAVEDMGIAHIPMNELTPEQNQQIADKADTKLHYFPITPKMRESILKEGLPQYQRGGIIHKATGGQVLSIEQIKAEMLAKRTPVGLSQLQSIGVNEAPSLGIKAYVPPSGRPDNGMMPVGGVDTPRGNLPIGGIDMSQQPGHQMMPSQPGQPPQGGPQGAPDGAPPAPGGPTPPMGNMLQMTPQGQALAAMGNNQPPKAMADGGGVNSQSPVTSLRDMVGNDMQNSLVPQPYQQSEQMMPGMNKVPVEDKLSSIDGPSMAPTDNFNPGTDGSYDHSTDGTVRYAKGGRAKVEVRPTVFDDKATRKTPEIETAIKALSAGIIDQKEYARIVQKYKPVKPYDFVPAPASDEDAARALKSTQQDKWRSHEDWPQGHPVGLRLDIPAYENHGVWVNSVHDEGGTKRPTSYGSVSSVKNATFEGKPEKAVRVASGEQSKAPFARIKGELHHMTEDEAVDHMKKCLNHPDWVQVGYDPRRHGDFYDRETMKPVTHSEHVVQIGPLVLAKKPKYGKRSLYATGGNVSKGFLSSTPQKIDPRVGQRFSATPQGNLAPRRSMNLEKYENKGSIVPIPYDATTRDMLVSEISGHQLQRPLLTEGGFDYSLDKGNMKQNIGGASNLGIASRVQKRVDQAAKEHPGDVFLVPNTMSDSDLVKNYPENFSHHPVHIIMDLMEQRQLNKKTLKALTDDLRSQVELVKTPRGVVKTQPYKNFVGFGHPEMHDQIKFGGNKLETTAGNLRKKIVERLGQVNIQKLLDYNLADVRGGILDPNIMTDPKAYMGHTFVKAKPGAPLRSSRHGSYDTDYTGKNMGGLGGNRPLEIMMPDVYTDIETELKQRPQSEKTPSQFRAQVVGALEKRKDRFAQPINARVINNAGLYEEGLRNGEFDPKNVESVLAYFKRKGGYKKGGGVKLHTDKDTMALELSRKPKKAK